MPAHESCDSRQWATQCPLKSGGRFCQHVRRVIIVPVPCPVRLESSPKDISRCAPLFLRSSRDWGPITGAVPIRPVPLGFSPPERFPTFPVFPPSYASPTQNPNEYLQEVLDDFPNGANLGSLPVPTDHDHLDSRGGCLSPLQRS
jgi:hypothetical protein